MPNQGFSFLGVIEDGEKALDSKLYRIAFLTALIIPSVCARIEYRNEAQYIDEHGHWRDHDCYVDWCYTNCIQYLDAENKQAQVNYDRLNRDYYEKLYDIRCAVVHESSARCEGDMCTLCINSDSKVCKQVDCDKYNRYDVCLISFCKQMFEIGRAYYSQHREIFENETITFVEY